MRAVTKQESKHPKAMLDAIAQHNRGDIDKAAKTLSALYRASSKEEKFNVLALAKAYRLLSHPDFMA